MNITPCPVPRDALLQRYVGQGATYTDCFRIQMPHVCTLSDYLTAFYTTPLFRIERLILGVAAKRPSRDEDVIALAHDQAMTFAAWEVEARGPSEILLRDFSGHTRSWLAVDQSAETATLFFGSAVVTQADRQPISIRASLPLHVAYSRLLLKSAHKKLLRQ